MEYVNSSSKWIWYIQAFQEAMLKLHSWSIFRNGSFLLCKYLREIFALAFSRFGNINIKTKLFPLLCASRTTDSICVITTTGKSTLERLL